MTYPVYVPTRMVAFGGAAGLETSDLLAVKVRVTASRSLVWEDTGYRLERVGFDGQSAVGYELQIVLPRTDVAGWRDPALNALIDVSAPDSYTHRYTAELSFVNGNGVTVGSTYVIGPFVVPDGAGVIDLDKTIPVSTLAGDVVQYPDLWGTLVADAAASAAAAEAALVDSAVFVNSTIETGLTSGAAQAIADSAELSNTFVAVEGSPADGDAIIWDDVAGQWVPAAVEGGGTSLTVLSEAEGNTGTETTARAISAARLKQQIEEHAPDISGKLDTSAAPELIRDTIGTALVAGTNVTLTVDDGGDTITIGATGGGGAVTSVNTRVGDVVLTKVDVGLPNVDNTSDVNKPVSTAQAAADALAIPKVLVDAKGDLIVATANDTPARLAVGTDGQVLTADSAQATGVKWVNDVKLAIPGAVPSMGTADTRFTVPPAVKPKDWFGDDPSSVYFQRYAFLVPWQLKRVDAWFNNIGTAGGVRIGLYASVDGRPSGNPVLEMTKTYTDLAPPAAGGSNQRTWNFSDTVWREPGIWFLAYTHWGSGMSVLNMESEPAAPRVRLTIGEIAPDSSIVGSDWWKCNQSAGNTLPNPVDFNVLVSAAAVPWMSLGFSAP